MVPCEQRQSLYHSSWFIIKKQTDFVLKLVFLMISRSLMAWRATQWERKLKRSRMTSRTTRATTRAPDLSRRRRWFKIKYLLAVVFLKCDVASHSYKTWPCWDGVLNVLLTALDLNLCYPGYRQSSVHFLRTTQIILRYSELSWGVIRCSERSQDIFSFFFLKTSWDVPEIVWAIMRYCELSRDTLDSPVLA